MGSDLVEGVAVDVICIRRSPRDLVEYLFDPDGYIAARVQVGGVEGMVAQRGGEVLLDLLMCLMAGLRPEEVQLTRDALTRAKPVAKQALV